jgi:hypothetical protein
MDYILNNVTLSDILNLKIHQTIKVKHPTLPMTYSYEIMRVDGGFIYNYFTHALFVPNHV